MSTTSQVISADVARRALEDLLNIESELAAAEVFIACHGELRPDFRADEYPAKIGERLWLDLTPGERVQVVAKSFRTVLNARTELEMLQAGKDLDLIFAAYVTGEPPRRVPPAMRVNYRSGGFDPAPRDLLDSLALELLRSHEQIARCAWSKCGRWFVKSYPLDKYCGYPRNCGLKARREAQAQWMREHRLPKARKSSKKGKSK
jgi:hypothetical protein